jgi:hypothetical protein
MIEPLGGLAIGEVAGRAGMSTSRIRYYEARGLLPELDDLIARATSVRRVLKICSKCSCESIDVCWMFDERVLPLREPATASRPARRPVTA